MSSPFNYFQYQKGTLASQNVALQAIVKKTGTPVYIYSAEALLKPLAEFNEGLKTLDHLVCFAMKSNSNVAILNLLGKAGAGMDLVSGGELYRAQIAGIPAERIVFSGVGKTPKEIASALKAGKSGIFSFNVESLPELHTLSQVATSLKRKASVALRFNPDVDAKTHPYISTGLHKNKFGMNRDEILSIAYRLNEFPGISLNGISIHIGSQLLSLSPLDDAFLKLRKLIDEINSVIESPIQFVDLGGGVGITYKNEKSPKLAHYCAIVQKHFGPKARKHSHPLKILIEPGRVISGNAGVLVTEVLYRKVRLKRDFLIVDAAMNDLMRPALYGSYHDIVPVHQSKQKGKRKKTSLVGPICESADCFGENRLLPETLDQGDLLAILSAGAYGFSMANNYNSRPRPPEVLIEKGRYRIIRKRETEEDLIRGELIVR